MAGAEKKSPLILVVDDDASIRVMVCMFLQEEGFIIAEAENGEAALEVFDQVQPQAVLLDAMMPVMNGFDACRALRKRPAGEHVPVMIITGLDDVDSAQRAYEAGATDFTTKPFNLIMLGYRLRYMLRASQTLNDLQTSLAMIRHQDKMASTSQLSAGVAREINNPLGFIKSNLSTLNTYFCKVLGQPGIQEKVIAEQATDEARDPAAVSGKMHKIDDLLTEGQKLIAASLEGTDQIRRIVDGLKDLARRDVNDREPTDINRCLETTINLVWNGIKNKALIQRDFGELPHLSCYPHQLSQVFGNLLLNAAQAIEKQGEIRIKTWCDGEQIYIAVADTGCGIPADNLKRIFEPFFTTREIGKGAGLGMTISYDIVKNHGGELKVTSEVGKGTTFTLTLPLVVPMRVQSPA
ncbi:sensor histidine kinase [Geopsychrobacter electrodiphilus]|uniref:sensor histidine kinase n=1 Tax=Geopsychrobacter electrodiphilus TaxID=225196 RepID=UPI00035F4FE1|nr:ATP-binding protein [Geopsychrobacter electrodiphilus]